MTFPLTRSSGTVRRLALLAAAGTVAGPAALGLAPDAAGGRAADCSRTGTTIDANSRIRLYRVGSAQAHVIYACARTGKRRKLGTLEIDGSGLVQLVLAGRYVAYDNQVCNRTDGGCTSYVEVRDALTGRYVRSIAGVPPAAVSDIVLTPTGEVAWLRAAAEGRASLHKSDAEGEDVLLDDGSAEPGSLALAGTRVYWTSAGQPRSAQLRRP
jgi:hypothetical protein